MPYERQNRKELCLKGQTKNRSGREQQKNVDQMQGQTNEVRSDLLAPRGNYQNSLSSE